MKLICSTIVEVLFPNKQVLEKFCVDHVLVLTIGKIRGLRDRYQFVNVVFCVIEVRVCLSNNLLVCCVMFRNIIEAQFQVPIIRLTHFRKKTHAHTHTQQQQLFNKTAQTIKNQEETFNNTTHFRAILYSTYYIQTTYPKDKTQGAVVKVKSEVRRTTFLSRRGWGIFFFPTFFSV